MQRREFVRSVSLLAAGSVLGNGAARAATAAEAPSQPHDFAGRVQFHNVAQLLPADDGDGWRMCRVPAALLEKLNASARRRAFSTAGCEIRFNLVGDEARIHLKFAETRGEGARWLAVLASVCHGDYQVGSTVVRDSWTEIVVRRPNADLPGAGRQGQVFDPALVRVQLPLHPEVRIRSIVGDVAPPRRGQSPSRHYLAYGSSITNGFVASEPGAAYPARLSRMLGVDAFNLGLGGGAHLEPEVADFIGGRRDWDFASLELGINLVGGSMTPDEFRARVDGFLPRLVKQRPDNWIICTDIFTCMHDFRRNPKVAAFRAIVRDAVKAIGSARLVHLDGRELLADPRGLSDDLLHPVSDGFAEIAEKFAREMRRALP